MRCVDWDNWGLRFFYTPPGEPGHNVCAGFLAFPVGPNGPVDGVLGSEQRQKYARIVKIWKDKGILPEGCEIPSR